MALRMTATGRVTKSGTKRARRLPGDDWELILEGLDHVDQGFSIFDSDLHLVLFNRSFVDLHGYPEHMARTGEPFETFVRFNAERGRYGPGDVENIIRQRVMQATTMEPHHFLRPVRDGKTLEIRRAPLPKGGFITTYVDVTERIQAESELKRNLVDQEIIAAIMQISLQPISLLEMLRRTLDFVLSSHGLGLKHQGSIFLVDHETRELVMVAEKGLHQHLLTACARVPFGHCLCGRAADARQLVFAGELDHRHDVRFEGIKPHGHYCVPIQTDDTLLGVLNLYVPDAHQRNAVEERFVTIVANALAGIIRRKQAEDDLREGEERLRSLVENVGDDLFVHDFDGRILSFNRRAVSSLGYSEAELRTMSIADIAQEFDPERYLEMWRLAAKGSPVTIEGYHRRKDGTVYPVESRLGRYQTGRQPLMVNLARDITERKQAEERIRHAASHDSLTDLPNRSLFLDRLDNAIAAARRSGRGVGVLFIDLDGFKKINDTLGHKAGDQLLQQVAVRLRACVREMDTVSRHGGDEFAVVLTQVAEREGIARVADKMIGRLAETFILDEQKANIGASIGIALYPGHGDTAEALLQQADAAMYGVKRSGKNAYRFAMEDPIAARPMAVGGEELSA